MQLSIGSSAPTINSIGLKGGSPSSDNDLESGLQLMTYSAIFAQVSSSSSVGVRLEVSGKP